MSTPADDLSAAARLVREKAKHATDGPWTCSPVWSPDATGTSGVYSLAHPTGTVKSEVVASGRIKPGYGGIRNPHNAVWITLMQPAVAEHLAASLDDHAQDHNAYDCTWDEGECPHVRLARTILGSTS